MASNIRTGIIGVFALLLGAGGTLMLNPGELDNAYVCNSPTYPNVHEQLGIFERISSTGSTAYPNPVGDNTGSKLCKGGVWTSCEAYAASKGLSCTEYLAEQNPPGDSPIIRRERVCMNQQQGNSECVDLVCRRE